MILEVYDATASQEAEIRDVLVTWPNIVFDKERLLTLVRVRMVDDVDVPGDSVDNAAYVSYNSTTDEADIYLERRLENDTAFFRRTIAHELGHIVIAHLTNEDRRWLCEDVFGKPFSEWSTGSWETRPEEATAEAFVDAFLYQTDPTMNASNLRVDNQEDWDAVVARFQSFDGNFFREYFYEHKGLGYFEARGAVRGRDFALHEIVPKANDASAWQAQSQHGWLEPAATNLAGEVPGWVGSSMTPPNSEIALRDYGLTIPRWRKYSGARLEGKDDELGDYGGLWSFQGPAGSEIRWHMYARFARTDGQQSNAYESGWLGIIEASSEPNFISPKESKPQNTVQKWDNRDHPLYAARRPEPNGTGGYRHPAGGIAFETLTDLYDLGPLVVPFRNNEDMHVRLSLLEGSFLTVPNIDQPATQHYVGWTMERAPRVVWERDITYGGPYTRTWPGYASVVSAEVPGRVVAGRGPAGVVPRGRRVAS